MNLTKKISDGLKNAVTAGSSPQQLTYSFCIGLYIAFSPFPGAHTIMMFLSKYLFGLHLPTLFFATNLNNPWTMIPFYTFDYVVGYWITHSLIGLNPTWTISLAKLFGSGNICLWSFFVGGNLLGLLAAIIAYPIAKVAFEKIAARVANPENTAC